MDCYACWLRSAYVPTCEYQQAQSICLSVRVYICAYIYCACDLPTCGDAQRMMLANPIFSFANHLWQDASSRFAMQWHLKQQLLSAPPEIYSTLGKCPDKSRRLHHAALLTVRCTHLATSFHVKTWFNQAARCIPVLHQAICSVAQTCGYASSACRLGNVLKDREAPNFDVVCAWSAAAIKERHDSCRRKV